MSDSDDPVMDMLLQQRRNIEFKYMKCRNLGFLIGSMAFVELLWSIARNELPRHRITGRT